jgi:hypothetical protein
MTPRLTLLMVAILKLTDGVTSSDMVSILSLITIFNLLKFITRKILKTTIIR